MKKSSISQKIKEKSSTLISSLCLQICVIANVCPETVDEVFALVPSLKVSLIQLGSLEYKYVALDSICVFLSPIKVDFVISSQHC